MKSEKFPVANITAPVKRRATPVQARVDALAGGPLSISSDAR
ncbi:MAG TPA: hypothetical protein VIE87_10340 [Pseudolabrys sp.]|jgi:hypothetical protein